MSELRVDSVKSKGGGAPDLPKGVTISGITTAVTLGATQIDVSNVNVSGVVTSGTLSGDLLSTGTPTLGLGVTINSSGLVISGVATAGIVSATTLYGDGSNLTGIGATIAPLFYQPDPYDSAVVLDAGIGITFNSQVKAGSGEVTLRLVGAAGTVVENFGVGSSVTISENRITINPTADLSIDTVYHLSYPSGCFTNNEGTDYVGTAYTFNSRLLDKQGWTWGYGGYGNLGVNNAIQYSSPVQLVGTTWRSFSGENVTKLGTKTDGTLWAWGRNLYGNLGQNQAHNQGQPDETGWFSPKQIPGTNWSTIHSSNYGVSFATKTDGTLWAWGWNANGQLGLNGPTSGGFSSPVQVPGTTWATSGSHKVAAITNSSSGAVKADGTLWTWGSNENGRLGHNQSTSVNISSPTQIPGTNWKSITSQAGHNVFATRTDGTLWGWGMNNHGDLGLNDTTFRSSPTQIYGSGTNWSSVISLQYGAVAIKTDGTLWSWGYNNFGQLGQNSPAPSKRSSPVQVPGTTWSSIAGTRFGIAATKTDGTLWNWGYNHHGQLGQNQSGGNFSISSPVQVGSDTNWSSKAYAISGGEYYIHAIKEI